MAKITISDELQGVGLSGSNVDLEGKRQDKSYLFCLQRVAVTNETSDSTYATIGVKVGSNIKWIETIDITTKAKYYSLKEPVYVNGGQSVIIRFGSTTTNDILKAFVYGYIKLY